MLKKLISVAVASLLLAAFGSSAENRLTGGLRQELSAAVGVGLPWGRRHRLVPQTAQAARSAQAGHRCLGRRYADQESAAVAS